MKNPRQNIKTSLKQSKKEKLVFVRSSLLYGLTIERSKAEATSINRGITSTPTFVFYSNNTKCLIDYTNQTNSDIEPVVSEFFSQMTVGATLTFFNGEYTDTNANLTADLSGQYTFKGYYKGIVEANVGATGSLSASITRYDKTRFNEIPYFTASAVGDGIELKTIIKNKMGRNTKNSFNYLGLKVGDWIQLTGYVTPMKVLSINIDSDGNEYVSVDANLTEADLTSKKTKVSVSIGVIDSYTDKPDTTETEIGACIEYANGVIISCTDNHTLSQCRFRTSTIKGITTEITLNTFCATPETDTAVQSNITENLVQITSALVNAVSNSNNISGPILKGTNSKNSFYGRPF